MSDSASPAVTAAARTVEQYLLTNEIEFERAEPTVFAAVLPGEHRLRTTVSLVVGDYSLSVNAFVVRNPDENHERVYRWLLKRNQKIYGASYAIDHLGDIYLVAKISLAAVDLGELDRLMGSILENGDGAFDYLLELGFETAIRREWKWRLDRGESTRNLEAFRHLATPKDLPPTPPA
ncbi:MAG: YbjN domain-containing protein [Actinobacteria bacterium]|nr:YbjN domain-containing protein [Actinomycetota bacterium]